MQENHLTKKYKVAIISPVPFFYHIPLYRALAGSSQIALDVIYCSDETLRGLDVKKRYNPKNDGGKNALFHKDSLLEGYHYEFLKNYSFLPSFMNWPFGLMNFGAWKVIKNGKYDAVVLQSWTNMVWWVAFLACLWFKTDVFFMTDSNILSESSKTVWKKNIKHIFLGNLLFKYSAGFFTSGKANEMFYENYGVPAQKMIHMPFSWGYEKMLEKAEKMLPERSRIRELLGLAKDDFVVLYVGRLSEEKMPLILLEAYQKISAPNKKLWIVGDGPMRKQFTDVIKQYDIKGVTIFGFVPHERTAEFYAASDVLVLPSKAETWGIVVNEAMCFGLPVIASDKVGSVLDLLQDGYNGFVFPVGNVEELSLSIKKIMDFSEEQRRLFSQRSIDIIKKWVSSIKPDEQIITLLKTVKK